MPLGVAWVLVEIYEYSKKAQQMLLGSDGDLRTSPEVKVCHLLCKIYRRP